MYEYKAKILEVIDGDTFILDIDLGFDIKIKITCRLLGIDTPEKFVQHKKGIDEKQLGLICKLYAKAKFEGSMVKVRTQKPDSFGRTLCNLYFQQEDKYVDIIDYYNELGFNKLSESFNSDNILKYSYLLEGYNE